LQFALHRHCKSVAQQPPKSATKTSKFSHQANQPTNTALQHGTHPATGPPNLSKQGTKSAKSLERKPPATVFLSLFEQQPSSAQQPHHPQTQTQRSLQREETTQTTEAAKQRTPKAENRKRPNGDGAMGEGSSQCGASPGRLPN